MAIITGLGFAASPDRQGRLAASEANLAAAIELLRDNELSLMAMTTSLNLCLDTTSSGVGGRPIADLVEGLEVPPPFGETFSGGWAAKSAERRA